MTISNEYLRESYAGNGSTTAFAYRFRILAEADLLVVLQNAAGVDTIQTLTTHYTISGVGDAGGGTVTMVTPPATGETLSIIIDPELTQLFDLIGGSSFPIQNVEDALDKLTNIVKRTRDLVARSLTLDDGDVAGAGAYSAGGNRIESLGTPTSGSDAATRDWVLGQISGGGAVDTFEFPYEYAASYVSSLSLAIASQPTDFAGNKILLAGRRVLVVGSTLGSKIASIETAVEGAGATTLTIRFDDGSTLSNESMTLYASVIAPAEGSDPHKVEVGQGALYAVGTQGGAYHGRVFTGTYTPGTDQHYTLTAKAFTGTITNTGSAPGSDHVAAIYSEAQRGAGSSDGVWAFNPLVEVFNLAGPTIGIEVDLNNRSGVDPGLAPAQEFLGVSVVNGWSGRGGTAFAIARNGAYSNNEWNRGLHIKDTLLRGIEFTNCGNATGIFSDTVLKVKSLSDSTVEAALQLLPFDDDNRTTAALFYITDAGDSNVEAYLSKRGAWHLGRSLNGGAAGMVNARQNADGEDTIFLQRFTDTSPTGNAFRLANAANAANLMKIGIDGRVYAGTPNSAAADSALDASQVTLYLNEGGNQLVFKAKYADGSTVVTGTVALS